MKRFALLLWSTLILVPAVLKGQEAAATRYIVDGMQIDLHEVDIKTDTLTIVLSLQSYRTNPREFMLNTFATQVVDADGQTYLYSVLHMGNVLVRLEDRQNYLHYLLKEDEPVRLRLQIANWQKEKPQQLLFVFEDSSEKGKFITETVGL